MKEMNIGPEGNVIEMKTKDLGKCKKSPKVWGMRDKKIKIERVKELWNKFAFLKIGLWGDERDEDGTRRKCH